MVLLSNWNSIDDDKQKIEFLKDLLHEGNIDYVSQFIQEFEETPQLSSEIKSCIQILKTKCFRMQSVFDDALELIEKVIIDNECNPNFLIDSYLEKANILLAMGRVREVEEYTGKVEKIEKNEDYSLWESQEQDAGLLYIKGLIRLYQGDVGTAIIYFESSAVQFEKLGRKRAAAMAWNNIGVSYRNRGELDEALRLFLKGFELANTAVKNRTIAYTLANIGYIHYLKGDFESCITYSHTCINLFEEFNDNRGKAKALHSLIAASLEKGVEVDSCLTEFKKLSFEENSKYISLYYRFSLALKFRKSKRIRDIAKAGILFEEIIQDEKINNDITIDATKHLIELLISELRTYNEPDVLCEIKTHLDTLY
ncbi:MAG: tetratricopeptide repeat protein, partial [Candidatus Kariarchaeaceae archaeon]